MINKMNISILYKNNNITKNRNAYFKYSFLLLLMLNIVYLILKYLIKYKNAVIKKAATKKYPNCP